MATLTLGQMLETALGSSRAGPVDFEQLHSLLNALLLHLGLQDLLVMENGEPLEGAEESPFAFLKELKERVETNEKNIAELRTVCLELREEVNVVKMEQSQMAENMQYMLQNFNMEQLQSMMDEFRNQLWESFMSAMKEMLRGPSSRDKKSGQLDSEDDQGLIVIGNEIPLTERPKTSKRGENRSASPSGKTEGKEKDEAASGDVVSTGESDTGQGRAQSAMARRGMGQKDMRRNVQLGDTGQSDMGRDDMRRKMQCSDAGQSDMGQKAMGKSVRWSDRGRDDMGQIKDEEIERDISEVEALPSSLDSPSEMTDMGEIEEEETKMGLSKAKSSDGSFTTSEMHPGAPGSRAPVQQGQSVRGQPGSQDLWVPAESMPGTSSGSRLPAPKDGRGGGGVTMEAHPDEAGLMLLRVPSSEYAPCEPLVKTPGQRPEFLSSLPPLSPGLSMRLPRRQENREEAADGYSRRSPMYSGGKHTSASAGQRMEPLLPDPNLPGTYELMGKDGVVYRGRTLQD